MGVVVQVKNEQKLRSINKRHRAGFGKLRANKAQIRGEGQDSYGIYWYTEPQLSVIKFGRG